MTLFVLIGRMGYRDDAAFKSAVPKRSSSTTSKFKGATSTAASASASVESQAYMDSAAATASPYLTFDDGRSSSGTLTGESPVVPDYDRPSVARPYSPRTFSSSSSSSKCLQR